jgi:hypothetical protein
MLDPVIRFFQGVFAAIGRGIGIAVAALLWPFVTFRAWLSGRGWYVKIPVFALLLALAAGYAHLFYITQFWRGHDPAFAEGYNFAKNAVAVGERKPDNSCQPSALVTVTADLAERNVGLDSWVSSHPLFKAGLFGLDWKETPFFDNKAAFQLGVNQVLRRNAVELVDRLGRVRGTSSINPNLQAAREAINYREDAWYFTFTPPFLQPSTQTRFADAQRNLRAFNEELSRCAADFDARADNLMQYLDRVTGDIGATSDILQKRLELSGIFGFDRRADDRFWFAYGQLYAYRAVMKALRSDFREVVTTRNLDLIWNRLEAQLADAARLQPWVVANGSPNSIIKSHLETVGFALLRVRSNLVEIREILDR